MEYDIVILGSGLGGLECGYILSKKGYNVCILEKNNQIGGCLQTFKRSGTIFDTGFHYVGGLEEGQSLHSLFRYFSLLDLPWQKMDESAFAEVILNDKSYFFASGYERFSDILSKDFPEKRKEIENYSDFLKNVGNNIWDSFNPKEEEKFINSSLFTTSAYSFLNETITDPLLRNVLSGASLTMELSKEKLPLYVFSQINSSFIQSAWRLKGGGSLVAEKLAEEIRKMGGTILTKACVTEIIEKNGKIDAVVYNNEEYIRGKYVISNLHPALTLSLIPESEHIRRIYKTRIYNLQNTCGMFTTHLKLKKDTTEYLNRNIFLYKKQDPWEYCNYSAGEKVSEVLISYQVPDSENKYTDNIDILTPMHWQEVEKWSETTIGKRGKDYEEFKLKKADECIKLAAERIPGLKNNIEKVYTSTPLTYRDYTGTWNGSAYGIQKDYGRLMQTMLSPQMQIPNLLLTGQNLSLHGILGVSMTSIVTCARIIGTGELLKELNK
ncbi:MAG: NAD(P)/FAD-dependent oxidoreductase [Bacteroidales bacterium]|jgi:all-trans-retinol 13,14-reductase|nr:NAD(P)/FAD-dependent oxidoreductase [Bacteroidales bacterium]